jgi:hypothetical protein
MIDSTQEASSRVDYTREGSTREDYIKEHSTTMVDCTREDYIKQGILKGEVSLYSWPPV